MRIVLLTALGVGGATILGAVLGFIFNFILFFEIYGIVWNGSNVITMSSVNATVTIYCDGTIVDTKQFTSTTTANQYVFDLGTYITEESGEYTISIENWIVYDNYSKILLCTH